MSRQADPNSLNLTDNVDECSWPPVASMHSAASVLLLLR